MKVFNRTSKEIKSQTFSGVAAMGFYVREGEKKKQNSYRVVFNARAVHELDLKHHDRIEFVLDIDRLYFFVNNDSDKGFLLTGYSDKKPNPTLWVSSKALCYHMKAIVKGLYFNRYHKIRRSVQKINGLPLYEVLVGPPLGRPRIDQQTKI